MNTFTPEQLQEDCEFSLMKRYECAHCMGIDDSDITPEHEYEIVAKFPSQFGGYCTIEEGHRYRKGEWVYKLRRADNPMVGIPGVACKFCASEFPYARA